MVQIGSLVTLLLLPAGGGAATALAATAAPAGAALALHLALALPNRRSEMMPAAFARLQLELPAILALVVATAGWPRARRGLRAALVAVLGATVVLKLADLALFAAFSRPFNPVTDLFVFPSGLHLVAGAAGPVVAAVFAAVAAVDAAHLVGGRPATDPPGAAGTTALAARHVERTRAAARDLAAYRAAATTDPMPARAASSTGWRGATSRSSPSRATAARASAIRSTRPPTSPRSGRRPPTCGAGASPRAASG